MSAASVTNTVSKYVHLTVIKCLKPLSFWGSTPSTPQGALWRAPACLSDRYNIPKTPELLGPPHPEPTPIENNVLKINDLYRYSLGQFMYQLNNNTLPSAFNLIFIKNKTIHKYPTRQSDEFHLPLTRTLLAKSIITYAGPKLWTILDVSIKNAPSLNSFKFKLKKSFLHNYQELALPL